MDAIVVTPLALALQSITEAVGPQPSERDALIAAKCRGLMRGYDARWLSADIQVDSVERFVTADLINPDTNRPSRTFRIGGKLDFTGLYSGQYTFLMDHKTTSNDISDPSSPYWQQLAIDGQATLYMLLEWMNGRKVDYALWDVIRKPAIRPKELSAADHKSALMTKTYFGYRLSDSCLQSLEISKRETFRMYEFRLAQDCADERPNWYFQRRMIPRLDAEVLDYWRELWGHGQEIIHVRATQRHDRNPGACLLYNSPCKFLGICSGHDSPNSDKWQKKQQVHKELPILGNDGRDLLTNSRVRSFQTCRRKAYYEYEIGIERQDEEEKESLFFGSLMHKGLEAWFLALSTQTGEVNDYTASGFPLIEGGTTSAVDQTPVSC